MIPQSAMTAEAESLSPVNLSAARQHVRTLSTREREALLRALLEQYESPPNAVADGPLRSHDKYPSRPRHAPSTSSISALSVSIFDCPSLPEEADNGSIPSSELPTALSPPPPQAHLGQSTTSPTSITSTSTSWPIRSASTSAVATTPPRQNPRQPPPHVRSHSTSHSALRSSFSTSANRQTTDSVALFHYRSKSYTASPEIGTSGSSRERHEEDKHVIATATAVAIPATTLTTTTATTTTTTATAESRPRPSISSSTESSDTVFHGGLNIITPANADILQGPATVENGPRNAKVPFSYWCTSCGDQFSRRSLWAEHDVTCRSTGRHHGRRKHPRPQRAWACGFCAAFLGSVERYQDHVAGHFERGKRLSDWHYANVIYGLLHQPVVHQAWKQIWAARAAALAAGQRPKATWPSGCKFPTKRLDAFAEAPSASRTTPDTRNSNSNSTDSNGDEIIYIGLKEVLESFDPALESASAIVLHAESLAIFISVPTDEQGSKAKDDGNSRSRRDKEKSSRSNSKGSKSRSRSRPTDREELRVHRATSTTITAVSKPHADGAASSNPANSKTKTKTATGSPPTSAPAPLTLVTGRSKDDPLPALPLFVTPAASLSSQPSASASASTSSSTTATATTSSSGKQRLSSVKNTALKPLNIFRSKDGDSATKHDKEKKLNRAPTFSKQRFKTPMMALGSSTTVTAGSPPNTTAYRPLPPLVMDNNYQGVSASASASTSPSSSPDTKARLVAADHYTVASRAGSLPSKKKVENIDMERMGTSYVDGFMSSINAKRAVR